MHQAIVKSMYKSKKRVQLATHYRSIPVSIIVPVYNAGDYLTKCIESLNFSCRPAEIILIDDCSTDNSFAIAIKLAERYPNIKLLQTVKNSGAAEARRKGIFASKQAFIGLLDADDFLEEGAIEDAYDKLSIDIDLVIWELWKHEVDGTNKRTLANPNGFPVLGDAAVLQSLGEWRIHPLGIARKEVYLRAFKEFDVESYNADELITRLVFKNCRAIAGSSKKYFYRTNPASTTQRISDKHLTGLRSHIWLIRFCVVTKGAPVDSVIKGAISSAYHFFKNRTLYCEKNFDEEMFRFLSDVSKISRVWRAIILSPKHYGALIILFVYASFRGMSFRKK